MSAEPMHEMIKFRLSDSQKQAMRKAAQRRGQSVSALCVKAAPSCEASDGLERQPGPSSADLALF